MFFQKSCLRLTAIFAVVFSMISLPAMADRAALYEQNGGGSTGIELLIVQ